MSLKRLISKSLVSLIAIFSILCQFIPVIGSVLSKSENGFNFMDGRSKNLSGEAFLEVCKIWQAVNICLLILGIILVILSIINWASAKNKNATIVIGLAVLMAIIYLVEGLFLSAMANKEYKGLSSASRTDIFYTASYLDLIFQATLSLGYIIIEKFMPTTLAVKNSDLRIASYDELFKLKKLYDDGVLTEQEYNLEKNKLLN